MSAAPGIIGVGETPLLRRPGPDCSTAGLLADAIDLALADAGVSAAEVDGLGVGSFTLRPDRAIDFAWRMGLGLRWCMQEEMGGASAINLLRQAWLALAAGQARTIVLVAGDHFVAADFTALVRQYNRSAQEQLTPLGSLGPNPLFAMLTQQQMRQAGLQREDYGRLCVTQRRHAAGYANAAYSQPMCLQDYLDAPMIAPPLGRLDCVPVVSGAAALVLSATPQGPSVHLRGGVAAFNLDRQESNGLSTGLASVADALWAQAGCGPQAMDVLGIYDDYPAMVLAQLQDLGVVPAGGLAAFTAQQYAGQGVPLNTAGGQLSAGQAGVGGGMHLLVEVARQLLGRAGARQLPQARLGLASGYGMVQQRYGMCANAVVLEGRQS